MVIRQLSVFLENSLGQLHEACECLGAHGVNLRALSLADATDFGVLRVIVDQPDTALRALKAAKFVASTTEVIAVEVPDQPGGLASALKLLAAADINVEYMYAFIEKIGTGALVVMRVEDVQAAVTVLQDKQVRLLSEADVAAL